MKKVISVVSDTHNFFVKNIVEALEGSDLIIHAGDIGNQAIIDKLEKIAKVVAVRGNSDYGDWAKKYFWHQSVNVFGKNIYVVHDLEDIDFDPKEKGIDMVVSGHTHKPKIETIDGVIYLNPGAILTPTTFARVNVTDDNIGCEIIAIGFSTK
ncbi:MAG: metallophosphoesterase family protein [Deltaproteobacteria bacterium]|nr:metallophosphoesterase family protein [Deltaproteobacteria bacterium]